MLSIFKKFNFYFLFIFSLSLVFLSKVLQIVFVKENSEEFYLYEDPIFINPDSYYFLNLIKEQLIQSTSLFSKLISTDLLTFIFINLYYIFNNLNLPELVLLSSPYFSILLFISIFFLFSNITDKYLALLISFITLFSHIIFFRTSVLFFDQDTLNLTFYFSIVALISLLLNENLKLRKFYILLFLIILFNQLFIFHYSRPIFSIIFFLMTFASLIFLKIDIKHKILFQSLFFITMLIPYGYSFIADTISSYNNYSSGQELLELSEFSISSTVSELRIYSLFEVEELIFNKKYHGLAILFSIIGILIFILEKKNNFILFIPSIVFSYLTFQMGIRFIIYLVPFFYFGFLYLIFYFCLFIKKKLKTNSKYIEIFFSFFITLYIWNNFYPLSFLYKKELKLDYVYEPYFNKEIAKGLIRIDSLSDNYNIITAWDYGYFISYYTNSQFHHIPGSAFYEKKFEIFFFDRDISNSWISENLNVSTTNENYFFITNDFIKWWPTINNIYTLKNDTRSNIIGFNCSVKNQQIFNCISKEGITSTINLEKGEIDGSKILYSIITNMRNSSNEKIINEKGSVTLIYSPELKDNNIYAIFPKTHNNKNFIKYFFKANNDKNLELIDDRWPYYKTYRVLN